MYLKGPAVPYATNEIQMFYNSSENIWYLSIYLDADLSFEDIGFNHYLSGDTIEIGGNTLPSGTGIIDGPLFVLPHAGFYLIQINDSTYEYNISDGKVGINTLDPRATLEVFGSLFSTAHYITVDSTHVNVPGNVNTVVITGSRPDSVIVNIFSSFADGEKILIQNWCHPKAVVPMSVGSVTIYPGECAEFLNTSYTGIRPTFMSKSLQTNEVWLTSGNTVGQNTPPFLGTLDSIDVVIKTNNEQRLIIKGDGNMGLGTADPQGKFQINAFASPTYPTLNLLDSMANNLNGPSIQFGNINSNFNFKLIGNTGSSFDGSNSHFKFLFNEQPLMSLTGDGNLGIGVLQPFSKLSISSIYGNQLSLQNSNALDNGVTSSIHFGGNGYTTGYISTIGQSTSNARMGFFTGYSFTGGASYLVERLSISNNGNIGIGTTTPSQKLELKGTMKIQDGGLNIFDETENVTSVSPEGSLKIKGRMTVGEDATSPQAGAIRWNPVLSDFEGFTGTEWVSFTKGGQGWGHEIHENSTVSTSETDTTGLHYYGHSMDIFENRVIIGAPARDVGSQVNQGKAYIFLKDGSNWTLESILTASDGDEFDYFGVSVAMHGDYAIVGASTKQVGANENQGKVYFFKRTGNSWIEEYNQTAQDGYYGDYFGSCVNIFGDYAVVGAPWKDLDLGTLADDHGKIYIYHRSGIVWNQTHSYTSPDNQSGDRFGTSVSLDSMRIAAGAPTRSNGGGVYILERTGIEWNHTTSFSSSDIGNGDNFGYSLDLYKNYLVVGAHGKNVNFVTNTGKAYVFKKNTSSWSEESGLIASDPEQNDLFGWSVSIYENYIIIGALFNNNSTEKPGKAYVFSRAGSGWQETKKLIPSQSQNGDEFGSSVSISAEHAFVGARRYNNLQGKAFYFKK